MTDNKHETITGLFIKNIPNLLTLLNMLAGLAVLYLNIGRAEQDYRVLSYSLILVAATLDAFDGRAARLLDAESELGKQLDSFADFISFGIAPIAVLVALEPIRTAPGILFVLLLYPIAGAFRLTRYNLGDYSNYFTGLPITAAGFIQACFGLFLYRFPFFPNLAVGATVLLTALLSAMMVANFKVNRIWLPSAPNEARQNARL